MEKMICRLRLKCYISLLMDLNGCNILNGKNKSNLPYESKVIVSIQMLCQSYLPSLLLMELTFLNSYISYLHCYQCYLYMPT